MSDGKSYAGAAYNALMEEASKEGVVVMLLDQFDKNRDLRTVNAALLEALELMVLRVPRALSWCDGGSSPYATGDIGDCRDAVEVGRAAIALAKVKP